MILILNSFVADNYFQKLAGSSRTPLMETQPQPSPTSSVSSLDSLDVIKANKRKRLDEDEEGKGSPYLYELDN